MNLSESGKKETISEESFCSNFVCCGVKLADLHALLQHYEDVHVKLQNGDDDLTVQVGLGEENDEAGEVDVVGDSLSRNSVRNNHKRTDSVLSTHSFGSTAAADALLGVATTYQPFARPRTEPMPGADSSSMPPPGFYYAAPPPPAYYAPPQAPRGEQPVSAFETTILRTVSPAVAGTAYPPHPYPSAYYPYPVLYPVGPHHPHHAMYAPAPHMMPQQHLYQPTSGTASAPAGPTESRAKRPKPSAGLPNLRAVQAASNTLRDSLPAQLSGERDPNQFKLIYSILSNTLTPSSSQPAQSEADSKEQEAIDKATAAKNTAAAILAMPRPPVDKSLERPYICPVPGCGKAYKNPNGLKYHALHGHDGTNELVERPYKCPYGDCGKRYKNPNGLKYHVNKNHADMLPKSALMAKGASAIAEDDDAEAHDHSDSEAHDHSDDHDDEE